MSLPRKGPEASKSTPIVHAHLILKRTAPLDKKPDKTHKFHFRFTTTQKKPDPNSADEKKAAEELKKRKAAVAFMSYIYLDDKYYKDENEKILFVHSLLDEPEYAEQIIRTKASNERCNLTELKNQLENILKQKLHSKKDPENQQRIQQYSSLLQIVEQIISDYAQDAGREAQIMAKDLLKQFYGNLISPKIRQQFVLALLTQNKKKQKEILCAQAKSNYSHVVCLIAALILDKDQSYENNDSYASLLQDAKKVLLKANLEAIQHLDLFGLVIFEQCVLENLDKKEKDQLPKIERRLSILNLFGNGNGTAEAKKKTDQAEEEKKKIAKAEEEQKSKEAFKLTLIKHELGHYQTYLRTKYPDIEVKDDQLLVKKKWNYVSALHNCKDYTAFKQHYHENKIDIESILSTDRDSEIFGLRASKYFAAFFMTIACQNSDVLWKIKSKELLAKIQDMMSDNYTITRDAIHNEAMKLG